MRKIKATPKAEENIRKIEEKILEMYQDPQKLRNWLSRQLDFSKYSANNRLLILSQAPDATFVATYKKWEELGFPVKESGGISLLKPRFLKVFINENGEAIAVKKASKEQLQKIEKNILPTENILISYSTCVVFDITKTEATEEDLLKLLPEHVSNIYPVSVIADSICDYYNLEIQGKDSDRIYNALSKRASILLKDEIMGENNKRFIEEAAVFSCMSKLGFNDNFAAFKTLQKFEISKMREEDFAVLKTMIDLIGLLSKNMMEEIDSISIKK